MNNTCPACGSTEWNSREPNFCPDCNAYTGRTDINDTTDPREDAIQRELRMMEDVPFACMSLTVNILVERGYVDSIDGDVRNGVPLARTLERIGEIPIHEEGRELLAIYALFVKSKDIIREAKWEMSKNRIVVGGKWQKMDLNGAIADIANFNRCRHEAGLSQLDPKRAVEILSKYDPETGKYIPEEEEKGQ